MGAIEEKWLTAYFDEVEPLEFYRDIWPEGELEARGQYVKGKYCGIAVEVTHDKKSDGRPKIRRYSITDDLEIIDRLIKSDNFCLCSPISYAGKNRTAENARFLYGIAIDLDKLICKDNVPYGLQALWNRHIEAVGVLPKPTYIISSGTGLHLYYLLERPIALFKDTAKQLQAFKRDLTERVWGYGIVDIKDLREIQQEGIYQGFRMPGTITKTGSRARAFLTGPKWTIEGLNEYVDAENRVDRFTERKELTLAKAAEKYPEWYGRRILKNEPRGVWHVSRRLYDWWKAKIMRGARVGHRYNCLMILAMYAKKCSMYDPKHNPRPVTREELEADCWGLLEHMEALTDDPANHFTEADVLDALEAFEERWITYPRKSVEYKSGIVLPENKRNGRKQKVHLAIARSTKAILKVEGEELREGRPSKRIEVETWQAAHPGARKADCIRDTGIDRKTVSKYWK